MSWTVGPSYGPSELRETLLESMFYIVVLFEQGFQADGPNGFLLIFDMTFDNCIHVNPLDLVDGCFLSPGDAVHGMPYSTSGFCGISCGRCRCLAHSTESRRHQLLRMRMDGHCWFPYDNIGIGSDYVRII